MRHNRGVTSVSSAGRTCRNVPVPAMSWCCRSRSAPARPRSWRARCGRTASTSGESSRSACWRRRSRGGRQVTFGGGAGWGGGEPGSAWSIEVVGSVGSVISVLHRTEAGSPVGLGMRAPDSAERSTNPGGSPNRKGTSAAEPGYPGPHRTGAHLERHGHRGYRARSRLHPPFSAPSNGRSRSTAPLLSTGSVTSRIVSIQMRPSSTIASQFGSHEWLM